MKADYSLYLVTDSTKAILGDRDLVAVVKAAVEGGVTIVQLRDKTRETAELIRIAKELHSITSAHQVPLLINDRVDVALAAGAEGVHIGQDDIDIASARKILGPDAIIGVTTSTEDEAIIAAKAGADYLGIGTVYATQTKENTKTVIGTSGVRNILSSLGSINENVKTVCIGGIKPSNAQRVLYQTATASKELDGVAIVSAIIGAPDPKQAAAHLKELISHPPPFAASASPQILSTRDILDRVPAIVKSLGEAKPLCHNMTNLVVQNFAANVALAIGASPIMSNNGDEAADLAALNGALVINMGTTTADIRANHLKALSAYNIAGGPVILDPVGCGATQARREGVRALMAGGYFDVIKGNEGEIKTIAGPALVKGQQTQQRGVDSGTSTLSGTEKATLVRALAAREHNVVLMTGSTDYLSDGARTVAIRNGHAILGAVTGTGCTLGTTIAAFVAVHREDKLLAALTGILMYEIAAERAAERDDVRGPGTFVPAFLDELFAIRGEAARGADAWVKGAKVEVLEL
ncbi:hypothetical protein B0A49_01001 [Cryomyces minteri]|uniref:Thiamine phosphate synthase/TenI domain-containing protein n=3 Tax=Cryomyces TaxID=329878 RepID=A0A4U0XPK1_9PEZI|nr:hypothetical protein B0A49_01001 [Cryomyces minteri]